MIPLSDTSFVSYCNFQTIPGIVQDPMGSGISKGNSEYTDTAWMMDWKQAAISGDLERRRSEKPFGLITVIGKDLGEGIVRQLLITPKRS